ncbi:MAG: hypothetical protein ISR65_00500 [Bacteriovoracaceae bacterium]|nr:hypothetical protein [Bacteriovoracaceae bacterium]
MKQIDLISISGEFATRRDCKSLPELTKQIVSVLEHDDTIVIQREKIKILSLSFVDELLRPLIKKYSFSTISSKVHFQPELEEVYLEHLRKL